MKDVTLTFFQAKGRAELTRFILAYGDISYTDERITREEFAARKAELTFGQLPVLTVDGVTISQSIAIARFVAKEVGLLGNTSLEAAQADEMVDSATDLMNKGGAAFFELDPEKKKVLMAKHQEEVVTYFTKVEKILDGRGGQFLVGNALTWADLNLYAYLDIMEEMSGAEAVTALLTLCPKIADLRNRVGKLPNIEKWLQNRPDSVLK